MSSAAKLRNRGIAVVGAAAIVMTSFGPTAFAWDGPAAPGLAADAVGAVSWGLVDAQRGAADPKTQGATAVVPGAVGQAVGDIRLVVPADYEKGDYIDVELAPSTDPAKRILWSNTPKIDIAGPYEPETHVGATSGTGPVVPGETEETPVLKDFDVATPAGQIAPPKPDVSAVLVASPNGANRLRLTFNTLADSASGRAKFALTLSGLKVDVGSGVTAGNVLATAKPHDAGDDPEDAPLTLFSGGKNETIPAYVTQVSLTADTKALTADGTAQALGPVTVAAANGAAFTAGQAVTFTVGGATLVASPDAKVTFYGASGQIGSPVKVTPAGGAVSAPAVTGATRAVFTDVVVQTGTTPDQVELNLTAGGGIAPPPATLTSPNVNQTDIDGPDTAMADIAINPSVTRIGGTDRYETAVKIANRFALGNQTLGAEVDNLVIASGETFPDALSAGYLAATKNAPVLLTQRGKVPSIVAEFIRNRGVKNVYLVGGGSAISSEVEGTLRNTDAFDIVPTSPTTTRLESLDSKLQVTRIAGGNRFETNQAVNEYAAARTTVPVGTTVPSYGLAARKTAIVVNGLTPWDALAAGPLVAGSQDASPAVGGELPIVLTGGPTLSATAKSQFQTLDVTHAIFVGGFSVLPQSLEKEAANFGTTAGRLGGDSRWATAEAVGNFLFDPTTVSPTGDDPGFGFTTGKSPLLVNGGSPRDTAWADALAAGPLAVQQTTLLALTAAKSLPADTKDLLTANRAALTPVTALGLGDVVSTEVVGAANEAVAD